MLMEGYIDQETANRAEDLYKICESQSVNFPFNFRLHTTVIFFDFTALIDFKLYEPAFLACEVSWELRLL